MQILRLPRRDPVMSIFSQILALGSRGLGAGRDDSMLLTWAMTGVASVAVSATAINCFNIIKTSSWKSSLSD